ncbi:hypothetical protein ACFV3R_08930 [Streptomyces sp. NPDC059740]|uniref:hypothetical protein n=1 Tax=Streptomyces sp. NPDC059740 TaxID=3346926 RepID=UPI003651C156
MAAAGSGRRRLEARFVGRVPCEACGRAPMKLPGDLGGLCIACYAGERQAESRRAAGAGGFVPANFATATCLACASTDVDANGYLYWCNACRYVVRVAQ